MPVNIKGHKIGAIINLKIKNKLYRRNLLDKITYLQLNEKFNTN
jgi:hypothetical protein